MSADNRPWFEENWIGFVFSFNEPSLSTWHFQRKLSERVRCRYSEVRAVYACSNVDMPTVEAIIKIRAQYACILSPPPPLLLLLFSHFPKYSEQWIKLTEG